MGILNLFKKLFGVSSAPDTVSKDSLSSGPNNLLPSDVIIDSPPPFITSFYALSEKISSGKDIHAKIDACEKSYVLLPAFVKDNLKIDNTLPPVIHCRDRGPILYALTGQWDKAINAVNICIAANAYYPDDGSDAIHYTMQMCDVGQRIISYVSSHPGCLQKDVCKAIEIAPDEKKAAQYFLRYNVLLRKESFNKTNRLFLKLH